MPTLTIRHVTTYRYQAAGRPWRAPDDAPPTRLRRSKGDRASLVISPEPRSLRFVQDAFCNHVGIARFSGRPKELRFESIVCLEHSSSDAADLDLEE